MDVAQHIEIVRREGELFASAAERTSHDATVPTCPGWTVRDLVRHLGGIHSWATTIVREARSKPFDPFPALEANPPPDSALLDWFREGHAALVEALQAAPADLQCFNFLPAPSAKAFWARRQAHETAMHRADLEAVSGTAGPFAADQAVDGIEELLFGFMARPGQTLRSEQARTLLLEALDTPASWLIRIGPEEPSVSRETSQADCRVSATASDLFLLAWNRRAPHGLDVVGDSNLLDLWRQSVFVRWR